MGKPARFPFFLGSWGGMTINDLWYLITFCWGIACGWAVVKGLDNK